MASQRSAPRKLRLRALWLQVHKWLGILLAILIIPISLSGSALVWHDWLDETLNPARHGEMLAALTPSYYTAAATQALAPGERILSIGFPKEGGPVTVTAARPAIAGETRPVRTQIWLDPADGRVIDRAASNEGAVRVLHVLHGSLMVPGVGRQIVGWVGVAMLISSLTGLWLWWPLKGRVTKGLRWRRRSDTNDNIHHMAGFWVALPLAMLSFTGVWISFPALFAQIAGASPPPPRAAPSPPLAETVLQPDQVWKAAASAAPGPLVSIGWPTEKSPQWKVAFARDGGNAEVEVNDRSGAVTPPKPPRPESLARTMRRWHDGDGMGRVWQTIIFIGGIVPALLAVTGVLMWLRTRKWRRQAARPRKAVSA